MTEDELLAMPEADYMNPAQLAFFRQKLEALREEILAHATDTSAHLRESAEMPDPARPCHTGRGIYAGTAYARP